MSNDNTPHESRAVQHDGPSRRRVLKAAAVGAASTIGVAGTAAARPATFESPDAMRDAFADHEDLLADLADRGLVEGATAAELTLDPAGAARADGHEVVRRRWSSGGAVTEVKLVRRTDEGPLTVAVRPETGDSYAILGGESAEVVEPLASCCIDCFEVICCDSVDGVCREYCTGCVCRCDGGGVR